MTFRISTSTVALLAGCGAVAATHVVLAEDAFLKPNSLIISSTTYDNTQGAIAALTVGSPIGTTPSAPLAVAGNDYVNVWNNTTPDGSFGVTSAIVLTSINPNSGHVFGTLQVPTDQVVTSFSSKSELALNFTRDARGAHLVLQGYAGSSMGSPGVGALDVSNSDAAMNQDPTNPVTTNFGSSHFFHRTIVALDDNNKFTYTPTQNYGGDNGRAALLGSNGLYYTAGNSNAGSAATFGPGADCSAGTNKKNNCTSPDVTRTTGLEVVNPIDASTASVTPAIPVVAGGSGSAEVNPMLSFGLNNGLDKAGKDTNFRGVTEFNGALYFTKGSGSNGVQTVYTVTTPPQYPSGFVPMPNEGDPAAGNILPTVANATSSAIKILNGFPTDSSRGTGGDFAPFGLFFANATTLYVTDEGDNNATDVTVHAGLQKWVLDTKSGIWSLAYTLQDGLIGQSYGPLSGSDGPWPQVTIVGLRNLTGQVNGNGTATLWAVTATNSSSGDAGSDPNQVVQIIDTIAATAQPTGETFTSVAGPTYGTVYRGVAFVTSPGNSK